MLFRKFVELLLKRVGLSARDDSRSEFLLKLSDLEIRSDVARGGARNQRQVFREELVDVKRKKSVRGFEPSEEWLRKGEDEVGKGTYSSSSL